MFLREEILADRPIRQFRYDLAKLILAAIKSAERPNPVNKYMPRFDKMWIDQFSDFDIKTSFLKEI